MSRMRMAAGAAYCVVALIFGGVASAGEGQCWQPYEIEAARVRDFQIMMMLGSLKCRAINTDITAKYDKFYEKTGRLDKYNNALKLRFMRDSGIADGQHAYDDFITRLANSHTDGVGSAGFCQMADTLLTLANNAGDDEIPVLARNFSEKPAGVGDACQASTVAAATAPASAPVEEAKVVPVKEQTPVAIADAAAPAVTPQSAAAALEAAAVALQSAAASLKTQQAAPAREAVPEAQPAVMAVAKPVS